MIKNFYQNLKIFDFIIKKTFNIIKHNYNIIKFFFLNNFSNFYL